MTIICYSTHPFDKEFLEKANQGKYEIRYIESRLSPETASIAEGSKAVCLFVNDDASAPVLEKLAEAGVKLIVLRSAGYNHVDIEAAKKLGLTVLRVPGYSPHAVAEHTIALILSLNRKVHRAFNRVREQNFALDGLLGFDLFGKTCGIIGTGQIGQVVAEILLGFKCKVIAYDVRPNAELLSRGVQYTDLDELYRSSDIISLHCPLNADTFHMIDTAAFSKMKDGVMLINTGRGALIDTKAAIAALKSKKLGYLGLDVYEEEGEIFFRDLSEEALKDDIFVRLVTFPNVLITAHQAFFTREALANIAATTIGNVSDFESDQTKQGNLVTT